MALTDYERGRREGFKYWEDRPFLIDMPAAKRKTLAAKSEDYRRGWQDGSQEQDKAEAARKAEEARAERAARRKEKKS